MNPTCRIMAMYFSMMMCIEIWTETQLENSNHFLHGAYAWQGGRGFDMRQ
jgi:hypothetical protein